MIRVKDLKDALRKNKRENCPPYSGKTKSQLMKQVEDLGLSVTAGGRPRKADAPISTRTRASTAPAPRKKRVKKVKKESIKDYMPDNTKGGIPSRTRAGKKKKGATGADLLKLLGRK